MFNLHLCSWAEAEFHLRIKLVEDLEIGIWLSSLVKLVGGKLENFLAVFSRSWELNLCKDAVQRDNIFLIRKRYGDMYTNSNAGINIIINNNNNKQVRINLICCHNFIEWALWDLRKQGLLRWNPLWEWLLWWLWPKLWWLRPTR